MVKTDGGLSVRGRVNMKVFLCENVDWLLSKEAFSIYASCMYKKYYGDYKKKMRYYIDDPHTKVFVCEVSGKIEGMLVLSQTSVDAEVLGIAVSRDHRGQGVGKYILECVIEIEQLDTLKVQTDDESIGFYRKCGFTDKKEIITFPDCVSVRYDCEWRKTSNFSLFGDDADI